MATDARISTGLPSHPKTKKLIRRLGPAGGWSLVCLFLWAASNRSDGFLFGMSVEDIELAADWDGEEGAFVAALTELRFLDTDGEEYAIHDWEEHNPWAAGAGKRSQKAKWNAAKRHHGEAEANRLVPEYAAVRNAGSNASSTKAGKEQQDDSMHSAESSNAPSPSPSPSPIPTLDTSPNGDGGKPDESGVADPCPHQQIIDAYHRLLPMGRQVRDWTPARQTALRARWREKPKRQNLEWWERFFSYVAESDFLTGKVRSAGRKPFELSLDWLVKSENFVKVIEGAYENAPAEVAA